MNQRKCLFLFLTIILNISLSFCQDTLRTYEEISFEKNSLTEALKLSLSSLEKISSDNKVEEYDLLKIHLENTEKFTKILAEESLVLTKDLNLNRELVNSLIVQIDQKQNQHKEVLKMMYRQKLMQNSWLNLLAEESVPKAILKYRFTQQFENFIKKEKNILIEIKSQKESTNQKINEQLIHLKHNKTEQNRVLLELQEEEEKLGKLVQNLKKNRKQIQRKVEEKENYKNRSAQLINKSKRDQFSLNPVGSKPKINENAPKNQSFTSRRKRLKWPVENGFIAEKFGKRPHDIVPNVWVENNGVGILTKIGENVKVVHRGTVKETPKISDEGYMLIIEHGDYLTSYFTLASIFVQKGDQVNEGQIIGTMSNSTTSPPMLHFEIWQGFEKLNPLHWLKKK